jgi:hypothetical protein
MIRLLLLDDDLLGFYSFILILTVVVSWLVALDVINVRNNVVGSLLQALAVITNPCGRRSEDSCRPSAHWSYPSWCSCCSSSSSGTS